MQCDCSYYSRITTLFSNLPCLTLCLTLPHLTLQPYLTLYLTLCHTLHYVFLYHTSCHTLHHTLFHPTVCLTLPYIFLALPYILPYFTLPYLSSSYTFLILCLMSYLTLPVTRNRGKQYHGRTMMGTIADVWR